MSQVAVLGAGAWGTALAVMLARRGISTVLCVRREQQLAEFRRARENATYLKGIALPPELELSAESSAVVAGADMVVVAVPSQHARAAFAPIAASIRPGAIVVSAAKGIEESSLLTMTALLASLAPQAQLSALSGPGFAAELARDAPAALVAASRDRDVALRVQSQFAGPRLRIYTSDDVAGVEICGAVKNVIAIAAGVSDGLGLGSSARAALITRGLAEIMRLAEAAGGKRETAAGLSGLGDLVLTCTGELSRNRAAGLALARGELSIDRQSDGQPIAEGIANARSVHALAGRLGIEMPIVAAVYRALYEAEPPTAMVEQLLSRSLKAEF